MPKLKQWFLIFIILLVLFVVIFSLDFYFLSRLSAQEKRIIQIKQVNKYNDVKFSFSLNNSHVNVSFLFNISRKIENLPPVFVNQNPHFLSITDRLFKNFIPTEYEDIEEIWQKANSVSINCFCFFENLIHIFFSILFIVAY